MHAPRTGKMHSGGTVIGRALRELWRTLRDDCRAIPRRAWWQWGSTLAIGFAACCAFSYVMTRVAHGYADRGLQAWDEGWLMRLADEGPFSLANAILLESAANLMYLIPLTVTASIIAIRRRSTLAAITIQIAYWLARPIVIIGWSTWNRARPKLVLDGELSPPLHSFPSGHAALCVAVYGFLAYLWVRRSGSIGERILAIVIVALLTAVVSAARVRLGTHWPSDVIAGMVMGVAWVSVVILAYRRAATHERVTPPAPTAAAAAAAAA